MTSQLETRSAAPSRRALLAGTLGALGAWAAGAIGRPGITQAHDVDDVLLGGANSSGTTTSITNTTTGSTVLSASNTGSGAAIHAASGSGLAVDATSDSGTVIYANGGQGIALYGNTNGAAAVFGRSDASVDAAIVGWSGTNNVTGVLGVSGGSGVPTAKFKTGVYGYASQDSNSKGVYGESPSGWAGYFVGKLYTSKFHEMKEISAPTAPSVDRARLFLKDNGAGKTQLCVRFNTGAIQVLATQP